MKSEFTYILQAESITGKKEEFFPNMDQEQLKAVRERLQLKDLDIKQIKLTAQRLKDGCTIYVHGLIKAEVVQPCVVTLVDVKETIEEEFEGYFLDETEVKSFEKAKRTRSSSGDDSESDGFLKERRMPEPHEEPEIISRGKIEVGELIVQSLSLGINPYPHAPDALDSAGESVYQDDKVSPFSVLKDHIHNKK